MNRKIFISAVKTCVLSLLISLLCTAVIFILLYHNDLKTLLYFEKVDDYPLYMMQYFGGYDLDGFLKVGAENDRQIMEYLKKRIFF